MEWWNDFWGSFDGPECTTLVLSLAAVAVSVWSIVRTRAARPYWEVIDSRVDNRRALDVEIGKWVDVATPYVIVQQSGPGDAEEVSTQVVTPSGKQWSWHEHSEYMVTRGTQLAVQLQSGEDGIGKYTVRVRYRCLPDTRKVRQWETTVAWDGTALTGVPAGRG